MEEREGVSEYVETGYAPSPPFEGSFLSSSLRFRHEDTLVDTRQGVDIPSDYADRDLILNW